MTYNARQRPYRGVVYQSPSRASSLRKNSAYLGLYVIPSLSAPASEAHSLQDTRRSPDYSRHIDSLTPTTTVEEISTQAITTHSPVQTCLAETLPIEASARYETYIHTYTQGNETRKRRAWVAEFCNKPNDGWFSYRRRIVCSLNLASRLFLILDFVSLGL